MLNKIEIKKIIFANSMLEWIKILKDAIDLGKSFIKNYRSDFSNPSELDEYYFYLDTDYTAYALLIKKFNQNLPELWFIDNNTDLVEQILKNKDNFKNIDKLLKLSAFL